MPWRLRHEGTRQSVPHPITAGQIVQGLREGIYSPGDEVRGPTETNWQRLDLHPTFAEIVEHIEEEEEVAAHEQEDNHIDMNPLIDVCLVLLVFFILATTLSILQQAVPLPPNQEKTDTPPRQVDPKDREKYIWLTIEKKDGVTTMDVNGLATAPDTLVRDLERLVGQGKTDLILDIKPGVETNYYVFAYDCSRTARVVNFLTKATETQVKNAPKPNKTPGSTPMK
jgi:biopolymer transport protein ExbD